MGAMLHVEVLSNQLLLFCSQMRSMNVALAEDPTLRHRLQLGHHAPHNILGRLLIHSSAGDLQYEIAERGLIRDETLVKMFDCEDVLLKSREPLVAFNL